VEAAMIKLWYRAAGMLASVAGGIVAGAIFKKSWKMTAGEEEAPTATDARRGWREVLLASSSAR